MIGEGIRKIAWRSTPMSTVHGKMKSAARDHPTFAKYLNVRYIYPHTMIKKRGHYMPPMPFYVISL